MKDKIDVYILCPVRNVTEKQKTLLEKYIKKLQKKHNVYYPATDTKQIDKTGGVNICIANTDAIDYADEIHIAWDKNSTGSHFDLGVVFNRWKHRYCKVKLIPGFEIKPIGKKSFEHVIIKMLKRSN